MGIAQRSVALILGVCLMLASVAGCGYGPDTAFASDYRTVSVAVFENRTAATELGADLAEAIARRVETGTPYRIASPERADLLVSGVVRRARERRLSQTAAASLPQELEVTLVIDATWREARTGRIVAQAEGLEQVGRYAPPAVIGERVEVADRTAVDRLAGDVVGLMRAGW